MSNFWTRTFAGIVFLVILIGCIVKSSDTFFALFLLLTVAGTLEFYRVAEKGNSKPQKLVGVLTAASLFMLLYFISKGSIPGLALVALVPLLFLAFVLELFSGNQHPFENVAHTLLGIIYVALPFSLLNLLVFSNILLAYDHSILLGIFIIIWSSDTGAYLTGRKFGRTKLFERISPKKTWEGSVGGLLFALVAAFFISRNYTNISFAHWVALTLIIVVAGSVGDLIESMLKRSVGIKDSGNVIPGHGGILDRFDSFLFAAPFVVTYVELMRLAGA